MEERVATGTNHVRDFLDFAGTPFRGLMHQLSRAHWGRLFDFTFGTSSIKYFRILREILILNQSWDINLNFN